MLKNQPTQVTELKDYGHVSDLPTAGNNFVEFSEQFSPEKKKKKNPLNSNFLEEVMTMKKEVFVS